jgi:cysteine desulfurase
MESAREEIAGLTGCLPEEVIFTSSASESNNLALKGVFRARARRGSGILVSSVEHVSVLHPARSLAREGAALLEAPVDSRGRIDPASLPALLNRTTALVSIQHGNPEVGTIQPIGELCRIAKEQGALFHTDASLTAGLYPGLWRDTGADLMTLSPHLFHGPKGIAALLVRAGTRLQPLIEGGIQEEGRRAGTQCAALTVGFGQAARMAREGAPERAARLKDLSERLQQQLTKGMTDWVPTGDPERRVPGHLSLCIRYVEGEAVAGLLDESGILSGSGSACSRGAGKPSHVLSALGVDPVLARGALEICFSRFNAPRDAAEVGRVLPEIVDRLRRLSPLGPPLP